MNPSELLADAQKRLSEKDGLLRNLAQRRDELNLNISQARDEIFKIAGEIEAYTKILKPEEEKKSEEEKTGDKEK